MAGAVALGFEGGALLGRLGGGEPLGGPFLGSTGAIDVDLASGLGRLGPHDHVVVQDLDLQLLRRHRRMGAVQTLRDRRTDIYKVSWDDPGSSGEF